jgi:hypothetical protein
MRVFVKSVEIVEVVEGKPFDPFDWAQSKQAQGRHSEFRRKQSNAFRSLNGLYAFNDLSHAMPYAP